MATAKTLSGGCACGNIQWMSDATPEHLDFCYCKTCQKVSGAPFMAWMGMLNVSLKWRFSWTDPFIYRSTVGDTEISVAERTSCASCGCNISLQYHLYPDKTHVAASTINKSDLEMPKVGCHIWTKHVPSWYTIQEDGIERFHEFDPGFQAKLDEYLQSERSRTANMKKQGGCWSGLMPGDPPDYSSIKGPDTLTMADLWDDPDKARRP